MASIWKRPTSRFLTACWTDSNGKRFKRSTKTTDKKLAAKLARMFEEESQGKKTAKQVRRVLADIHAQLSGDSLATITVRAFLDGWLEGKAKQVAKSSLAGYRSVAGRFLEYLGPKADRDIAEIRKRDIVGFRDHCSTKSSPTTANQSLRSVRAFFSAAKKEDFLADNPCEGVETIRDRAESQRRPFTLDELRTLIAAASPEMASLIKFGFFTGQRLSDIAVLTWQNLDLARGELRLTTRKTGRRQIIPLPEGLQAHIASLPSSDDPAAPIHPRAFAVVKKNGRSSNLSRDFADLLVSVGLRGATELEEGNARRRHGLSYHSLRHTATSLLKDSNVPASVVMAYVGHDSTDVSQGYTHTGKAALLAAAAAFPTL